MKKLKSRALSHWLLSAALLAPLSIDAQEAALLADLIQQGDPAAQEALRRGADVNARQADGTSALHWAVYRNDVEVVKQLLSREADPNVRNIFGSTPLLEAVKVANLESVRLLLEAGADPNLGNEDNQTPLMIAADIGSLEISELLISKGANVNAVETWRGQNALMWASAANHGAVAKLLVKHGADVNLRAASFDWATQITSEPRAQYRPTGGLTPLLYAARGGCKECIDAILDAGADINLPDPDGVTPLMVAIDNLHFDVAAHLLKRGANPHAFDWWGRTPLYVAVDVNTLTSRFGEEEIESHNELDAIDVMRLLLEAGVDPNPMLNMHRPGRGGNGGRFTDDLLNSGATPLLRAANSMDVEAVRVLLEHGALVDLPNAMGVTPFLAAAGFGSPRGVLAGRYGPEDQDEAIETIKLLVAAGADINARVTDTTSLTARIARRSSLTDRTGQTAVYGAISQGWLEVTKFLVEELGLSLEVTDAKGKTPLDAAKGDGGGRVDRPNEVLVAYIESKL